MSYEGSSTSEYPAEHHIRHQSSKVSELRKAYSPTAEEQAPPMPKVAEPRRTVRLVRSFSDMLSDVHEDSCKPQDVPTTGMTTPPTTPPSSPKHKRHSIHRGLRPVRLPSGMAIRPHPITPTRRNRQVNVYAPAFTLPTAVADAVSRKASMDTNDNSPRPATLQIQRHRATVSALSNTASEWAYETNIEQQRLLRSMWKCETRLDHVERKKRELACILEKLEQVEGHLARLDDRYSVSPVQASSSYAPSKSPRKVRPRDSLIAEASTSMRHHPSNNGHRIDRSSSSRLSALVDQAHAPRTSASYSPSPSGGTSADNNTIPRWNRMVARASYSRMSHLSISSIGTVESLLSNSEESSISVALQPMPLFRARPSLQYLPPRRDLTEKRAEQLDAPQEVDVPAEATAYLGVESPNGHRLHTSFEEFPATPQRPCMGLSSSRVRVQSSSYTTTSAWEDVFTSFEASEPVIAGNDPSNEAHLDVISSRQTHSPAMPHWVAPPCAPVSPPVSVVVRTEEHLYVTLTPSLSSWEAAEGPSTTPPPTKKPLLRALKRCFSSLALAPALQPRGSPREESSDVPDAPASTRPKRHRLSAFLGRLSPFGRPDTHEGQNPRLSMHQAASSVKQGRRLTARFSSKRSTMLSQNSLATSGVVW
ncbi:hypothetical protein LTR56_012403 [Elasticomyces elasticus]|nr:hypothetical protein LTR56_012403 [Elasticomyces elasticus]KAK3652363.1 hypothetical protein LTR22_011717 [Elasticomyces elasticus]KAK4919021.1 hypothetical protein LTR49_013338 [Elasticomyces elasticus]KAK5756630.1 hypothetical protein LTS12_013220 [Elasticomyces elasticus]